MLTTGGRGEEAGKHSTHALGRDQEMRAKPKRDAKLKKVKDEKFG